MDSLRSALLSLVFALGFGLSSLEHPARASVTLTPVNAGSLTGEGNLFYAANYGTTNLYGGDFVDPNYTVFNITETHSSDTSGKSLLLFDLLSDTDFAPDSGEYIVITVSAKESGSSTYYPVPIAYAGSAFCVDQDNCQGELATGYLFAARYSEGNTVRVGLYPQEMCAGAYAYKNVTIAGCDSANNPDMSGGASGEKASTVMYLKFSFKIASSSTTTEGGDSTDDSTSVYTAHFQNYSTISFSCPSNLKESYVPGDGAVYVDPDSFGVENEVSGLAERSALVVVAKDSSGDAVLDANYATGNDVVAYLPFAQGTVAAAGFTNTTNGTDHLYNLAFSARDGAGIVKVISPECGIEGVQTSTISGFLGKSNCFIATAAWGDEDAPAVSILRQFRDRVLVRFGAGRDFVRWYVGWSPGAADWLRDHPWARPLVRISLLPADAVALLALHPGPATVAVAMLLAVLLSSLAIRRRRRIVRIARAQLAESKIRSRQSPWLPLLVVTGAASALAPKYADAADQAINDPYIQTIKESLRQDLRQKREKDPQSAATEGESYTARIKKKLPPDPAANDPYTKHLKSLRPDAYALDPAEADYAVKKKRSILDRDRESEFPRRASGAIADVSKKESDLRLIREGKPHWAGGFGVGFSMSRKISSNKDGVAVRGFDEVYGTKAAPELSLAFEYQVFHHPLAGSLGLFGHAGLSFYKGNGVYQYAPKKASGGEFDIGSTPTRFRFFLAPVSLGLNYRLKLLRYVQPYFQAGPSLQGYYESRSDAAAGHRGLSIGLHLQPGIAFMLDWISGGSTWSLYDDSGVRHFYLNAYYTQITTISGEVSFAVATAGGGLTFEF